MQQIGIGEFAEVLDCGNGTVVKAYLRKQHARGFLQDWKDHEALIRGLFINERNAYERLQMHDDLKAFTPRYYGVTDPYALVPADAAYSERYVSGCGIRLERISGVPTKVAALPKDILGEVEAVLWRIIDVVHPGNVWDSSCFIPGSQGRFTLIDFAHWDGFLDFRDVLEKHGRLSKEQWGLLGDIVQ